MQYMPVTRIDVLIAETRGQPMHVGGLRLFNRAMDSPHPTSPKGLRTPSTTAQVSDLFRKAARVARLAHGQPVLDPRRRRIDFDCHVRRVVCPSGAACVSCCVMFQLNRRRPSTCNRPMGGPTSSGASTTVGSRSTPKVHHSLVGVTALRILRRTLSTDPRSFGPHTVGAAQQAASPRKDRRSPAGSLVGGLLGAAGARPTSPVRLSGSRRRGQDRLVGRARRRLHAAPLTTAPTLLDIRSAAPGVSPASSGNSRA